MVPPAFGGFTSWTGSALSTGELILLCARGKLSLLMLLLLLPARSTPADARCVSGPRDPCCARVLLVLLALLRPVVIVNALVL